MNERMKTAANVAVIVMATVWVVYVIDSWVRARKERPIDVLISTTAPRED